MIARSVSAAGLLCSIVLSSVRPAVGSNIVAPPPADPVASDPLFPFRFENGALHYEDIVTCENAARHVGKVLEWADRVLLFDAQGRARSFHLSELSYFETRHRDRHRARPDLPDLTVAFVERLPRDPSWQGRVKLRDGLPVLDVDVTGLEWRPSPGATVTFRIHVLNAGGAASTSVPYTVSIGETKLAEASLPAIQPRATHVIEARWSWADGPHELRVAIDPAASAPEIARWNNTFVEPVQGQAVAVVVARDRYDAFAGTRNLVDTFCFEDYVQYHLRNLNALFARSIHPSCPDGIVERVRLDRILVVDDPAAPASDWQAPLHRDGKAVGLAEYAALMTFGRLRDEDEARYGALRIDWPAMQDLAAQLGLADLRKTDTTLAQCHVLDRFERFAVVRHITPMMRSLMHTPAGFLFNEHEAAYLNRCAGRPRGVRGAYQYQLPEASYVEVVSNAGAPLPGVNVDVFQLQSEGPNAGRIAGVASMSGGDPLVSSVTGADGRAELVPLPAPEHRSPDGYLLRPNPFGKIAVDGSNGLLLLRLRSRDAEEFHFLSLATLNLAYLRGHSKEYVHRVASRFGPADGPPTPPYAVVDAPKRGVDKPDIMVRWKFPENYPLPSIREFRIYKRVGFAGLDAKPWTLVSVVEPVDGIFKRQIDQTYFDEFEYTGPYSLDTYFAVSLVDTDGRESSLSAPAFLVHNRQALEFAVDQQTAYMTLQGPGEAPMLFWDGVAGTQPYAFKTHRLPGYEPHFCGIAFLDGRMLLTDPVNHVLVVLDSSPGRHELIETIPPRTTWPGEPGDKPGEFFEPTDVAVDDAGNIYVADRGNDRVQILDRAGKPIGQIDPDFRFRAPQNVSFANGHLCVTDKNRSRVRIYKLEKTDATFVFQLDDLVDAGRAIGNTKGDKYFVTGRPTAEGDWAVLSYSTVNNMAVFNGSIYEDAMGQFFRPRGLYVHRGLGNFAYFMNEFPYDVRRIRSD